VSYRHIILTVPAMFRTTFYQNAAAVLRGYPETFFVLLQRDHAATLR